jgi:four helix bundle protein
MNVALKESNETAYWLELLHQSDYLDDAMFESISKDAIELIKILVSIVKTSRTALHSKGK